MALAINGIGSSPPVASDFIITYTGGEDNRLVVRALPLQIEIYNTDDSLPIVGSRAVELQQTTFDIKGFTHDKRESFYIY